VGGVARHQYVGGKMNNEKLARKIGPVMINNNNIFHNFSTAGYVRRKVFQLHRGPSQDVGNIRVERKSLKLRGAKIPQTKCLFFRKKMFKRNALIFGKNV
jgi:hypothetical protein